MTNMNLLQTPELKPFKIWFAKLRCLFRILSWQKNISPLSFHFVNVIKRWIACTCSMLFYSYVCLFVLMLFTPFLFIGVLLSLKVWCSMVKVGWFFFNFFFLGEGVLCTAIQLLILGDEYVVIVKVNTAITGYPVVYEWEGKIDI